MSSADNPLRHKIFGGEEEDSLTDAEKQTQQAKEAIEQLRDAGTILETLENKQYLVDKRREKALEA